MSSGTRVSDPLLPGSLGQQPGPAAGRPKAGNPLVEKSDTPLDVNRSGLPGANPNPSDGKGVNAGANATAQTPQTWTLNQIALKLGFPQDQISRAILVFARFFSIPATPALLGLRELLFSSKGKTLPQSDVGKGIDAGALKSTLPSESKIMALVSAMDKGVSLSPEALERYSRFFNLPEPQADGKGNDADGRGMDSGGKGSEAGHGGNNSGGENSSNRKSGKERDSPPGPHELQALAEEEAEKDSLLDFMNRLPGENGQYWKIFPFKLSIKGIEFQIIIRSLKREALLNDQAIVDIAGPKKQWRFFLTGGKDSDGGGINIKADIKVYPEQSEGSLESLRREAEEFLGSKPGGLCFDGIKLRNGRPTDDLMPAGDFSSFSLPSLDREV